MSKPKVKPGVTVRKRQVRIGGTRGRKGPEASRARVRVGSGKFKKTPTNPNVTRDTLVQSPKPLGYRVQNKDKTNVYYGNLNVKNRTVHSAYVDRHGTVVGVLDVKKGPYKGIPLDVRKGHRHIGGPDSQNRKTLMGVREKLGLNLMDSIPAVTVELKGVDVRVGEKKVPIGVKIKPKPAPFNFWFSGLK